MKLIFSSTSSVTEEK